MKKINIFTCLRCGAEWASKQERPRACSRCKSSYWDVPRKHYFARADLAEIEKLKSGSVTIDQVVEKF